MNRDVEYKYLAIDSNSIQNHTLHYMTWYYITLYCIALQNMGLHCTTDTLSYIQLVFICLACNVFMCIYIFIYIYICINIYIYVYMYIYGKCLGFARNRNHDRQRIISIIIIIIIKPLLKIFNESRSSTGVGELNPYRRSSTNVEV